jgi:AraC-like DNA-binding protein
MIHGRFPGRHIPIVVTFQRGSGIPNGIGGQPHGHDFTELLIFHGGQGVHRVNDQDYRVAPGTVSVVLPGQVHALVQRNDLRHIEVAFDLNRLPLPMYELRRIPGFHALFVLEPRRRGRGRFRSQLQLTQTRLADAVLLAESMRRENEEHPPGYEAFLLSRLLDLMIALSRQYTRSHHVEARALLRVGEVIAALERDYAGRWTVDELCRIAHMSKSALMPVFREATGQTPIDYLIHVRLRNAMNLLRTTDATITQIALETGFSDGNYFARKFRQVLGTTPTAYRKANA